MSRLSHGHVPSVPSVPRTFYPLNLNFHIYRPKRPGCPWDVPNLSLGRLWGFRPPNFFCDFSLSVFLHIKSMTCARGGPGSATMANRDVFGKSYSQTAGLETHDQSTGSAAVHVPEEERVKSAHSSSEGQKRYPQNIWRQRFRRIFG